MFPSEENGRDAVATERAAELLERMLDRISRPNHDWIMIAGEAAELTLLAARMAAPASVEIDRPQSPAAPNLAETSPEDD